MSSGLTWKTINITSRATVALEKLRAGLDSNETDAINRAIVLHAALLDYTRGGTLKIVAPNGETIMLLLL